MKLFVTGGAGFIGSHFVDLALAEGHEVIVYDMMTYSATENNLALARENKNFLCLHVEDICNLNGRPDLLEGCDAVVHFAAESHVDRSITSGVEFALTNAYGTCVVLQTAMAMGVKRFVHVSTDEVYGSIAKGSFKETDPLAPNSPYSSTKAASDLIALSYWKTHRFPVIVTRSCNNFGPRQYPEKFIPVVINHLLNDEPAPVYGDGSNVREWIYVQDNCRAIMKVLTDGVPGEVYNIGSGHEFSNNILAELIAIAMDKDTKYIEYVADRLGHDERYALNSSKIHKLGFKVNTLFGDALASTIDWYRINRNWWC